MDYVETEGDSIDKAIENALKLLGVERDKITVDILSEGKKGILGFGAQKARIRATTIGTWRKKRRQWVRRRKKYWQRY